MLPVVAIVPWGEDITFVVTDTRSMYDHDILVVGGKFLLTLTRQNPVETLPFPYTTYLQSAHSMLCTFCFQPVKHYLSFHYSALFLTLSVHYQPEQITPFSSLHARTL